MNYDGNVLQRVRATLRHWPRLHRMSGRTLSRFLGKYEERFSDAMESEVRVGDCVWDVGANVGLYTRRFMELVGRQGSVVAIEPSPHCVEVIRDELRPLNPASLTVVQAALSHYDGIGNFSIEQGPVAVSNRLADPKKADATLPVRVAKGDTLVTDGCPAPDVIKIDVEGYELEVLRGLEKVLHSGKPRAIFVEVHFQQLQERGLTDGPAHVTALLRSAGYAIKWVDPSHLVARRGSDSACGQVNTVRPPRGTVPVTSIVLTLNEELNVEACLRTLQPSEQIIVVDSGSSDQTAAIAAELGAVVLHNDWRGYAQQRNWAMDQASSEWVLFVDADERVPPAAWAEIADFVGTARPAAAGDFCRRVFFLGSELRHGGFGTARVTRLLKPKRARFIERAVHEHAEIDGRTHHFRTALVHDDQKPFELWLDRHNRYSTLEAEARLRPADRLPWRVTRC